MAVLSPSSCPAPAGHPVIPVRADRGTAAPLIRLGSFCQKRRRASRDWVRSAENENWVRSAKTERVTRLGSFPQEQERAAPQRFGRTKPSQKLQGFQYGSKRPRRGRGVSLSHRPRE